METTAYIALSRQMVLRQRMDVIANNVANMTTTGFKAEALLLEPVNADAGARRDLAFVQDIGLVRSVDEGPMTPTGNPLDLAIEGEGYFVIDTPDGLRYGRGGQFKLNEFGEMVTARGNPVLDDGLAPIALPQDTQKIVVAEDGTVSGDQGVLGRLGVVTFADEQRLEKVGDGLYRTDQPPEPAEAARLVQGTIEGSNVQPVVEMTELIATQRAYQGAQKLIDTHDQLQRRAIERMLETTG